jgi:hypothetical protein
MAKCALQMLSVHIMHRIASPKVGVHRGVEGRIILALGRHRDGTKWDITKWVGGGIRYSSVLRAIKRLKKDEMIYVWNERKAKNQEAIKTYDLTAFGVAALMYMYSNLETSDERLEERFRGLFPEIFALWPSIKKVGAERIAQRRLRRSALRVLEFSSWVRPFPFLKSPHVRSPRLIEPPLASLATSAFLSIHDPNFKDNDDEEWIKAVRRSENLRDATILRLRKRAFVEIDQVNFALKDLGAPLLPNTDALLKSVTSQIAGASALRSQ